MNVKTKNILRDERYQYVSNFTGNGLFLELGCGDGRGCHIMAETNRKIIGIDINVNKIHEAQTNNMITGREEYFIADITNYDDLLNILKHRLVNNVVCFDVLNSIQPKKRERVITNIFKILAVNCTAYFSFALANEKDIKHFISRKDILELLRDTRFSIEEEMVQSRSFSRLYHISRNIVSIKPSDYGSDTVNGFARYIVKVSKTW